jgi:hypothetical protein
VRGRHLTGARAALVEMVPPGNSTPSHTRGEGFPQRLTIPTGSREHLELLTQQDLHVGPDVRPITQQRAAPFDIPIGWRKAHAHICDHNGLTGFETDRSPGRKALAGLACCRAFRKPLRRTATGVPERFRADGRSGPLGIVGSKAGVLPFGMSVPGVTVEDEMRKTVRQTSIRLGKVRITSAAIAPRKAYFRRGLCIVMCCNHWLMIPASGHDP